MSTKLSRCNKLTAPATTVSAGFKHSAAVCNEDVYLWGANNQGLSWVKEKKLGSHIYIHIYIYIFIHNCIYIHIFVYMYIYILVYLYIYIFVYMYM